MYKVALINMPFANLGLPSIALTQLKSLLDQRFGDQVSVEVLYLNHDFARQWGIDFCNYLANAAESHNSGLGDWFFRQVAFPNMPDNTSAYFERYFPQQNAEQTMMKRRFLTCRRELSTFMDYLVKLHRLDQFDLVGFTSMFMQNVASFAMAQKIKERNPQTTIVMGGANCESPMGQVIVQHVKQIDYVFSGPALISFPTFIQHCVDGEAWKCGTVKGVLSKKNYLVQTGPDAIGEELSIDHPIELDYQPFLHTVKQNFPKGEVKAALLFETSRGCWWGERAHCTFCGLNGATMAYRAMKPELALQQFDALFKHAATVAQIEAVDNILPKNYLSEVLPFLDTPENVSMFYEVKADLSEEDMAVLARARVKTIQPGIESLATSTLKLMRKGTSAFQNLILLKHCVAYDIDPAWNLLLGFPGEGEDVYEKYVADLPLLVHLRPPTGAYPVRFDRYSPYFTQADKYGLHLKPLDFYSLIYPWDEAAIGNMAYYFSDANTSAEYIKTLVRWIGKVGEKVFAWVARWEDAAKLPPKLHFQDDGTVVYDTRSGAVIEHHIGEVGREALQLMHSKPKRISELAKALVHIPDLDPAHLMETLRAKGLVFQEGDRFLSLVLNQQPQTQPAYA